MCVYVLLCDTNYEKGNVAVVRRANETKCELGSEPLRTEQLLPLHIRQYASCISSLFQLDGSEQLANHGIRFDDDGDLFKKNNSFLMLFLSSGVVAVSSRWSWLFFIFFHICGVMVVVNIIIATILESFEVQFDLKKVASLSIPLISDTINLTLLCRYIVVCYLRA